MSEPWERLPEESIRAYAAFKRYLDLGAQRSLSKLSQSYEDDAKQSVRDGKPKIAKQLTKSVPLLKRWSGQHRWIERMEAWEADQDREWAKERRRSLREANRRHTTLAKSMTAKIASRLMALRINELTPQDLARWLDVAVKIERLGLGLSTSNHEHTGHDGGPMEVIGVAKERLASLLRPVMAERDADNLDSKAEP